VRKFKGCLNKAFTGLFSSGVEFLEAKKHLWQNRTKTGKSYENYKELQK